jgi:hypothetical protein
MQFNFDDLGYITKEDILSRITEEEIFERYLGIKPNQSDIGKCIFKSPLREDSNPTCNFFYKGSRLLFKDYGSDYGEYSVLDCFNVVQYLFSCSFSEAIRIIAKDFNLIDSIEIDKIMSNNPSLKQRQYKQKEEKRISVTKRKWAKLDLDYWNQFGISVSTLNYFDVFPCMEVYVNDYLVFRHMNNQPIYAYEVGDKYKIYRPLSEQKWLANTTRDSVQGLKQISKGNILIITKALKDVMLFYEFGIPAIAPPSENTFIQDDIIKSLEKEYKKIYLNFDKDRAGQTFMRKQLNKYPAFFPLSVPDSYSSKDFTDLCKETSVSYVKGIVEELLEDKKERTFEDLLNILNEYD